VFGIPASIAPQLSRSPTLVGFAESCLIPYLFAISYKLRHGGKLLFDELAHGIPGLLADYIDLFGLQRPAQAVTTLKLLGMKKRRANKQPCPCDCGGQLGKCKFNRRVARFRTLAERRFYRSQAQECVDYISAVEKLLAMRQRLIPTVTFNVIRATA
jgi:hypothetical protein